MPSLYSNGSFNCNYKCHEFCAQKKKNLGKESGNNISAFVLVPMKVTSKKKRRASNILTKNKCRDLQRPENVTSN